jgi:hypothetical protein
MSVTNTTIRSHDNGSSQPSSASGTCEPSFVLDSQGSKIGPAPVSVAPKAPCPTTLTTAALATHDASDDRHAWFRSEQRRITRLQNAAHDLGFELPRKALEWERWELEAWLEVQGGR